MRAEQPPPPPPPSPSLSCSNSRCTGCGLPPRKRPTGELIPLRRCTRCGVAAYHDVICQRRHYPKHKSYCRQNSNRNSQPQLVQDAAPRADADPDGVGTASPPYRIERRPLRGNCMIASRWIPSGEPINTSKAQFAPLVAPVLFENQRTRRCASCFSSNPTNEISSDNRYCVSVCPTCLPSENASLFRQESDAVSAVAQRQIPTILSTAVLIFRIYCAAIQTKITWEDVECMISHPFLQEEEGDSDAAIHQRAVVMTVTALLAARGVIVDVSRIESILSRIKFNAFTIVDAQGHSLGFGLFRNAHFINHSCACNCTQSFTVGVPGNLPSLSLTAKLSIKTGEEITISYIDADSMGTKTRQSELKRAYRFNCQCPKCLAA